eukprot:Gb_35847 [translate_table: standard]
MAVMEIVLRVMPWLIATVSANVLHYTSLWPSTNRSPTQVRFPNQTKQQPETRNPYPFTFHLMSSHPILRLIKYRIKLIRYTCTFLHLILFYRFLPELNRAFIPGWGTVEAIVVGLLSGFITIYLNENRTHDMRTEWKPELDLESGLEGFVWDVLRVFGDALAVPLEEELFYHSWLYRFLINIFFEERKESFGGFGRVGLRKWNWRAWVVSNGVYGGFKGKEWRSYVVLGFFSQWVICRRGQFVDGVIAHALRNSTVNLWALITGQRQYL